MHDVRGYLLIESLDDGCMVGLRKLLVYPVGDSALRSPARWLPRRWGTRLAS